VVVAASVSLRNIGPQFFHLRFQKFIGHYQRLHSIASVTAASRDGFIGCRFKTNPVLTLAGFGDRLAWEKIVPVLFQLSIGSYGYCPHLTLRVLIRIFGVLI
jgi:hypothetical protein